MDQNAIISHLGRPLKQVNFRICIIVLQMQDILEG